jgi:peptidylprolyl isomerase
MSTLATLNDEVITGDFLIKYLKITDQYDEIMNKLLSDRITAQIARKQQLSVSDEELQERVDQIRRIHGLHRATDTLAHIESLGFTVDEFGEYIRDELLQLKMLAIVCSKEKINEYFKLHSPQFESVELRHIIVAAEGAAREITAVLEDDPESFEQMAIELSISDDTASSGGSLGKVQRGLLADEVEAKIFNANDGDILGPFESGDGLTFEVFKVEAKHPAELDKKTTGTIATTLKRDWIKAQLGEHKVELE